MKNASVCLLLTLALLLGLLCGCAPESPAPVQSQAPESASAAPETLSPSPSEVPAAVSEAAPAAETPGAPSAQPVETQPEIDYTHGLDFTAYPLVAEGEEAGFVLWTDSVIGLNKFYPNGFIDHPVYKLMEQYTGVHIDFKITNETTSSEQFNLMVVSGEYPDMVHRMNYNGGLDLAVSEDFAIDLAPYIEQYAPNFNYLIHMDNDAYMKDIVTDGGHIACFYCFNNDNPPAGSGLVIRADWLQKLGMEKPKTYDELHQVLLAFQSEFGATEPLLMPSETNTAALIGGYGTLGAKTSTNNMMGSSGTYYVQDGVVKFGLLDAAFKDYLMMIRKWMDEDLISETYQTDNDKPLSNTYTINISTGVSGVMNTSTSMLDDYQLAGEDYNGEGYKVEATYDIRMNEGDALHFEAWPAIVGGKGLTITTACKDVPLAMKWCDFWYSKEMTRTQLWGVEGESYTVDEDGSCRWTDQMINPPDGYNSMIYAAKYVLQINLIDDVYADEYQYSDAMKACADIWADNSDYAWTMPSSVALTADEASAYATKYTDIDTFVSENLSKFMTGEKPFEEWDAFIGQVYAMGIEDCVTVYQGAYDRYMAK